MDRQDLQKVDNTTKTEPQNSSAPIENKWLNPAILVTSVQKNFDISSKSNVDVSTSQMIGKR